MGFEVGDFGHYDQREVIPYLKATSRHGKEVSSYIDAIGCIEGLWYVSPYRTCNLVAMGGLVITGRVSVSVVWGYYMLNSPPTNRSAWLALVVTADGSACASFSSNFISFTAKDRKYVERHRLFGDSVFRK